MVLKHPQYCSYSPTIRLMNKFAQSLDNIEIEVLDWIRVSREQLHQFRERYILYKYLQSS